MVLLSNTLAEPHRSASFFALFSALFLSKSCSSEHQTHGKRQPCSVHIYIFSHLHTYIYTYIYIYIHVYFQEKSDEAVNLSMLCIFESKFPLHKTNIMTHPWISNNLRCVFHPSPPQRSKQPCDRSVPMIYYPWCWDKWQHLGCIVRAVVLHQIVSQEIFWQDWSSYKPGWRGCQSPR